MSAWLAPVALADSAVGVNPVPGNILNPGGNDPTLQRDVRGTSLLIPERSRTPGGFLYEAPYETRQALPLTDAWNYRLSTELGGIAASGPGKGARLRDYGDLRDGVVLNYFNLGLEETGGRNYFDFTAGAVAREDQYYRAVLGRYGAFKATLYFNELPRTFTDQARTIFQGVGGAHLTLPAGLVPGGNTPAQISAALQAAQPFTLGFTRKNGGLEFDSTPHDQWRVYARYGQDQKKGTRPFGGAAGYPGVPVVETIEPIDYRTHNMLTGAQWTSDGLQANVSYAASFFRNGFDALTWDYPLTVNASDAGVLQRGRMALYPDNAFHNLKLDWNAVLPLRGHLSGSFSWSRATQDEALIPPTVNTGILSGAPGVDLANWNTATALSSMSAAARIDTRLIYLNGSFSPVQDLSLQVKLRRHDENNRTRYTAFNPLTGQFGYLGLDGGVNDIVPALFRVPVVSIPFEQRKDNYGVEGDYRLLRRTNVTFGYEREDIRYQHRESGKTEEDRVRVGLNNRDISWATVRLSYEQGRRSGDRYNFDPNKAYYSSTALINAPPTLAELRKHDLADRRQQVVNARINFLVATDMDLGFSGRYVDNDYDAAYGRLGEQVRAFNVEWNWQPAPKASVYAHYGAERVRNSMALINENPGGITTGNPNAGGAAYPPANRWNEDSRDDAQIVGVGFRYAFAQANLESGYTYLYSPYRTRYGFASSGALAGGSAAAAGAGDGMPDLVFRQQALETSLTLTISKSTALRLYHRYERARFKDWHYDGLPLLFDNGAAVFLGAGPQNYTANIFGIFFQYAPRPSSAAR